MRVFVIRGFGTHWDSCGAKTDFDQVHRAHSASHGTAGGGEPQSGRGAGDIRACRFAPSSKPLRLSAISQCTTSTFSTNLVCKPKARKKRRTGPGAGEQKRLTAQYPMHVVSFDFQSDVTSCGRNIRFFDVIDEYTRSSRPGRSKPRTWSRCLRRRGPV
jgi:hypothetical protein